VPDADILRGGVRRPAILQAANMTVVEMSAAGQASRAARLIASTPELSIASGPNPSRRLQERRIAAPRKYPAAAKHKIQMVLRRATEDLVSHAARTVPSARPKIPPGPPPTRKNATIMNYPLH
jgi:hypothetical protein